MAIRRRHQLSCKPGKIPGLHPQLGERIVFMRIESGRDDQQLRDEAVERREDRPLPRGPECRAVGIRRQRHVHHIV